MVSVMFALAVAHGAGSVVQVSVAEPAAIAKGPGVYTALGSVASENDPSGAADHIPVVADPPDDPESA